MSKYLRDKGHLCLYLPKFHSELNPIELFWSHTKHTYRVRNSRCKTTMIDRIKTSLACTNSSEIFTRRCFRKVRDFIWAYRIWKDNQSFQLMILTSCAPKVSMIFCCAFTCGNDFGHANEVVKQMKHERDSVLKNVSAFERERVKESISKLSERAHTKCVSLLLVNWENFFYMFCWPNKIQI